jgi:hypothetical protein
MIQVQCNTCGKLVNRYLSEIHQVNFCSWRCSKIGNFNPAWKGGKPKCKNCGKLLSEMDATYCRSCHKRDERNPHWKLHPGLTSIHKWVRLRKPKPKNCESCGRNKPRDLANISQKYKRDINDFEWLCRSCHEYKDGRMFQLKNVWIDKYL